MHRHILTLVVLFVAGGMLPGCGKSESPTADHSASDGFDLDSFLDDVDLTEGGPGEGTTGGGQSGETNASSSLTSGIDAARASAEDRLELRLAQGDRFSLVKTVEQSLVQKSPDFPATARNQLELHMDLQVEDVQPGAVRLAVVYRRVAYFHDVNGRQLTYDSATHQGVIPVGMAPYAGMVNNGFSFLLGLDNRVREVIGYEEFLQRCVQNAPEANRAELLTRLGDSEVAGFIDDSIGLLPYDNNSEPAAATQVAVGDEWTRERQLVNPTSIRILTTCRLVSMTADTAEISVSGTLAVDADAAAQASAVQIIDGRTSGSCIVDRRTGLPVESVRSQFLNLRVTAADGRKLDQEKQIRTTIRSGNAPRGPVVQTRPAGQSGLRASNAPTGNARAVNAPNGILRAAGVATSEGVSTIPANSQPLSSSATAVYPD